MAEPAPLACPLTTGRASLSHFCPILLNRIPPHPTSCVLWSPFPHPPPHSPPFVSILPPFPQNPNPWSSEFGGGERGCPLTPPSHQPSLRHPPLAGLCLKGRGAIGQSESSCRAVAEDVTAVGGGGYWRLGMRLGAGVGVWECLFGVETVQCRGGRGAPPPPFKRFPAPPPPLCPTAASDAEGSPPPRRARGAAPKQKVVLVSDRRFVCLDVGGGYKKLWAARFHNITKLALAGPAVVIDFMRHGHVGMGVRELQDQQSIACPDAGVACSIAEHVVRQCPQVRGQGPGAGREGPARRRGQGRSGGGGEGGGLGRGPLGGRRPGSTLRPLTSVFSF